MTGETWTILAMGAAVFALRLGGLALPARALPTGWARGLGFVPIAVLSALVATTLAGPGNGGAVPLAAAAVGTILAWRTGRMWACLAGGLAVWWMAAAWG